MMKIKLRICEKPFFVKIATAFFSFNFVASLLSGHLSLKLKEEKTSFICGLFSIFPTDLGY